MNCDYYDLCKYLDQNKPDNLAKDWQTKTDEIMVQIREDKKSGKLHDLKGTSNSFTTA